MLKKKISICVIASVLLCVVIVAVHASFYSSSSGDNIEASGSKNNKQTFSDVSKEDWFYDDVEYVNKNGFITGTDNNIFSPYEKTTRGMIVTILWRIDGKALENGRQFSDVDSNAYYAYAVAWASNHQIVSGYDETSFGPDDFATREQLAAILYRYAEYKKYDISRKSALDKYIDKNQISDYALAALQWAHANEIITGTSDNTLTPGDYVQRCQAAAMLKRFCIKFNPSDEIEKPDSTPQAEQNDKKNEETQQNDNVNHTSGDSSSEGISEPESDNSASQNSSEPENSNYPEIIVKNVSAKSGDDVQVIVELKHNPRILGMALSAYYDESVCELTSVENGEAFQDILELTPSKTLNSGVRFLWDGIEISENDIKDGEILIMNFKIKNDAQEGKYPITLKYSDGDIVNNNLESIMPQIETGFITITNK